MQIFLVFTIILTMLFTLIGCASLQEGNSINNSPQKDNNISNTSDDSFTNDTEIDPPPIDYKPKKDTKLRPILIELVEAYERGDVEAFASSRGIKLRNGSVLVTIESLPGQMDLAKQAAINAGARLGAGHRNSQDIIIPIGNLTDLAEEESIRLIKLPIHPTEADTEAGD
ncbi:hypothetical protein ACFLWS_01025 [Chloroflexota bacterium]